MSNYSRILQSLLYKPKHPRMANIKYRLRTYSSWSIDYMKPKELAECGFYYTGTGGAVICYFCGGMFGNWRKGDNPWLEHKTIYPECPYLALSAQSKMISEARSLPDPNSEVFQQVSDTFPKVESAKDTPLTLQEIDDNTLALKQISETHSDSDDRLACLVCMDNERGATLMPCRHFATCWDCAKRISVCPICRSFLTDKIRIYLS